MNNKNTEVNMIRGRRMILKKCNAYLSLLNTLTLLIHVVYNAFAYFTFYYNPTLKTLTALPFIVVVCLHAICGMCAVFLMDDGTRLDLYRRHNFRAIIQRVSAALIFPLLILHLNTYSLLKDSSAKGNLALFFLIIFIQILFYAVVTSHIAFSFSNAFVTLGVLSDMKKKKAMDRIVLFICTALFITSSVLIVRGEFLMFLPK